MRSSATLKLRTRMPVGRYDRWKSTKLQWVPAYTSACPDRCQCPPLASAIFAMPSPL